jgi:hypothetical protein
MMVILFGGGLLLSSIHDLHVDPEIVQLLNYQSVIETLRAQPHIRDNSLKSEAPLLREAKAFAIYLNPPQPQRMITKPLKQNVNKEKPAPIRPPQPSFKFKVLATSFYPACPSDSMALIWQPGGDLQWVKAGERLGHFEVHAIKHGVLVYKDGEDLREVAVLSESEQQKGPDDTGHGKQLAANISHKLLDTYE